MSEPETPGEVVDRTIEKLRDAGCSESEIQDVLFRKANEVASGRWGECDE